MSQALHDMETRIAKLRLIPLIGWRYLLASLAWVLLGCVPAAAATIFVDWQNSGVQDGTAAHPYRTLPQAIAAAAPGDTLGIRTGAYNLCGGGLLNKPMTFRADNGPVTITAKQVTFRVAASQPRYPFDPAMFQGGGATTVAFTATLQNVCDVPVTVSRWAIANISIVTVQLEGRDLKPRVLKKVSFDEDPNLLASQALVTLAPQATTSFTIVGVSATSGGTGKPYQEEQFAPAGAGSYLVTFQYHYAGPDSGIPNVSHETLVENVNFDIEQ
jgi:hypothetical protein